MTVGAKMCEEGSKTLSQLTGEVCVGQLKREKRITISEYLKEMDESHVCAATSSMDEQLRGRFFMLLIPMESRETLVQSVTGAYSVDENMNSDMDDDVFQEMANILSSRLLALLSEEERGSVVQRPPLSSVDAIKSFREVLSKMKSKGIRDMDLIDMDFILSDMKLSVHVLYRKDEGG